MALRPGVVFDLDDTLYLEREYVQSGFMRVAALLHSPKGPSQEELFSLLWMWFERGVKGNTFNRLLDAVPSLAGKVQVEDLVSAYRSHEPQIRLLTGVDELIRSLRMSGTQLGILTDGPKESQVAKIRALGLPGIASPIVVTDKWGRQFWKPHPRGYVHIARAWGLRSDDLVYVGDNPEKDFVAARLLGWQTVRLRVQGQLRSSLEPPSHQFAADEDVFSVDELAVLLGA